jgi:hypothetical protein
MDISKGVFAWWKEQCRISCGMVWAIPGITLLGIIVILLTALEVVP